MGIAPAKVSEGGQPPLHVAVIMDGNGRWAHARGLPRTAGHKEGAEAVRRVIESAVECGIKYLTLYSFSSENWKRPEEEVRDLMGLLRLYLRNELKTLAEKGVRLVVIGDRDRLAPDIRDAISEAEVKTADNARLTLVLALSYGGRGEIVAAARRIAEDAVAGRIAPEDIDEDTVTDRLYTAGIPDPDLMIRTSGEKRISNFLLWQLAYAEFVFVDKLWPDFGKEDLADAIREFTRRDRRYGATNG